MICFHCGQPGAMPVDPDDMETGICDECLQEIIDEVYEDAQQDGAENG